MQVSACAGKPSASRRLDKIPIRFTAGLSRKGSPDDAPTLIELRRVHCHLLILSFSLPRESRSAVVACIM